MSLSRREFLHSLPAASAVLMAHEALAIPAPSGRPRPTDDEHLLRELRLLTAAPIEEMRRFYADGIGFDIVNSQEREFTCAGGATRITFTAAVPEQIHGDGGRGDGKPFYHFAFNIPEDKVRAARNWMAARATLIPPRTGLTAPDYPIDVWHFAHWNAHAIFFFDPAFNIVELIGRHDLAADSADPESFSVSDILYASEIGLVVPSDKQEFAAYEIERAFGLKSYPAGTMPAWAMGDERGLLLCLARLGEVWGQNTQTPVKWDVFPTQATIRAHKPAALKIDGFPYAIRSQ